MLYTGSELYIEFNWISLYRLEVRINRSHCVKVQIVLCFVFTGEWIELHPPLSFKQPCAETTQEGGSVSAAEPRITSQSLQIQHPPLWNVHRPGTQSVTEGGPLAGPLIRVWFFFALRLFRGTSRHAAARVHYRTRQLLPEVAGTDSGAAACVCKRRISAKWGIWLSLES